MKALLLGMILLVSACAPAADTHDAPMTFTDEEVSRIRAAVLGNTERPLAIAPEMDGSSTSILRSRIDHFGR